MGMFDEIVVRYPLPDPEAQKEVFQTKSLACLLRRYYITATGLLTLHQEPVPYHGDIYLYAGPYEYIARFTEGRVLWIKRVGDTHELYNSVFD